MARLFNVQAARTGGMSDQDIQAFLAKNPDIRPSQPLVKQQGGLSDFLPVAGGVVGGIAGSALGPLGSIGGGALGSGAGEALRQMIQGQQFDPGSVAKETGYGLVGGVGGELLGAGLRVGGKIAGRALEGAGENLAVKALRPSPSALTQFEKLTGSKMGAAMQAEGLAGRGVDEISQRVGQVQQLYDDAVINAGAKINPNAFRAKIFEEAGPLLASNSPDAQKIGNSLKNLADNIAKKYGDKMIDAGELVKDRRIVDKLLPKSAYMGSPVEGGVNSILRNTEKGLIDEATGGQTADLGARLQKLYNLEEVAQAGANKGAGALPINLTSLAGSGMGGAVAGVPGAMAGGAAAGILNNGRVIGAASRLATNAGKLASSGAGAGLFGAIGGQGAARLMQGAPAGQENTTLPAADVVPGQGGPAETGTVMNGPGAQSGAGGVQNMDPDELIRVMAFQDIKNTGGKNIAKIAQFGAVIGAGKNADKKQSAQQAARDEVSFLTGDALTQLASGKVKTGMISGPLERIKSKVGLADQDTLDFQNSIYQIKASIAKARAGTAFTPNEEKLLDRYTPTDSDSMQQLKTKLVGLYRTFGRPTNIAQDAPNGAIGGF